MNSVRYVAPGNWGFFKLESMKSKDLRIGNWYAWEAEGKDYFYQVVPSDFANDNYKNFKPIPLTEEWLVKAGFEVEYKSSFTRILNIDGDGFSFRYKYALQKGVEHLEYCGKTIKCEYVHQLQNLYHALTGEELTFEL